MSPASEIRPKIRPKIRLGVNIDHVATLRNARGGALPDPLRAAQMALAAGADGITAHLREDRRHIVDDDMRRLKDAIDAPLNFEMAATEQMLDIAQKIKPHACCLVPEKRTERTTEGGLDVIGGQKHLPPFVDQLSRAGIRVSLFIDADEKQLDAAKKAGAPVIEIHTGKYADADSVDARERELERISRAAVHAHALGLQVNAGHGLHYHNVRPVVAIPHIAELNIGHAIISEAVFIGLESAVKKMKALLVG